jgi:hypothetical protein
MTMRCPQPRRHPEPQPQVSQPGDNTASHVHHSNLNHGPLPPGSMGWPGADHRDAPTPAEDSESRHGGGHGWMMMICCIPMIAIAVLLFLTGVAGSGALLGALLCTVMMALMMFAMPGGHGHQ